LVEYFFNHLLVIGIFIYQLGKVSNARQSIMMGAAFVDRSTTFPQHDRSPKVRWKSYQIPIDRAPRTHAKTA
jgi:hypothetical protein